MPLDNILQALEAEGERQVGEIKQAAQVEVERIRAQAKLEAATTRQKHLEAAQVPMQAERARILNRAKLKALRVVTAIREDLIARVIETAADRLAEVPASESYAVLLRKLTQEAADSLGTNRQLRLCVQSRDAELMNHIIREMGISAIVDPGLENETCPWGCLGGLVASTPDRRIRLVNTLDARLQRVASLHRSQIAEMIFGDR
jgi:V/A-type H+-transporting ATPase subunit E